MRDEVELAEKLAKVSGATVEYDSVSWLTESFAEALARVALEFCEERWMRELARGRCEVEREDRMNEVFEECFGEEEQP